MTNEQLLGEELEARKIAKGLSVYSSNKDSYHDSRIKATASGTTSAACGKRWMELRKEAIDRGLTPHDLGT